jgi:hypothetical protein
MRVIFFFMINICFCAFLNGCGVKGDPVPPESAADIGRGKPLYKSEDEPLQAPTEKQYYKNGEQKDLNDDADDER